MVVTLTRVSNLKKIKSNYSNMSLTKQQLIFKKLFLDLLKDLVNFYKDEKHEFDFYYNLLSTPIAGDIAITSTFDEAKTHILKFKKEIYKKDEAFFLDLNADHFTEDSSVIHEIGKIKELFLLEKTTGEIKEKIWDYLQKISRVLEK